MKELSPGEALNKAASYCTLCERCVSEVTTKLTAWGVPTIEQQKIVARLIEEKFIDEQRYCRAFVNDKVRFNRWGRIKIAMALREKHLPQEYIKDALDNIDEEIYMQSLKEVVEIKHKDLKENDNFATQQKIIRYAASRGYEPALIISTIKYKGDEMDF